MKFTLSWLREYVDHGLSADRLAAGLTMAGLEVDSVEELGAGLDQVVIARVEAVEPHPSADRLHVCRVNDGEGDLQIVCGATNVRPGMNAVLARIGAELPGGFKIKKAKLRGVESFGMLCSEAELGLAEEAQGIMEVEDALAPGVPVAEALGLADTMIEVDLTPNRADCASVIGIAREVAAFSGAELKMPAVRGPRFADQAPFSVGIDDYGLCPRYCGCLIRGVKVGPSPWWLAKRLLSVGLRPINNVVDITNYVMLEQGQPLHAFDFARIEGGGVVARPAREGEKIVTLDGRERELSAGMLVIADSRGPVAVAGVMGGEGSQVSENTVDILLESACFSPVSVRRTARNLNLATDSSYRFERGVDPGNTAAVLSRAVDMILEICGGRVDGALDVKKEEFRGASLRLRPERCNRLLGTAISPDDIAGMLSAIGMECRTAAGGALEVTVPTFRIDIEREVDLIEEVARLVGYDRIGETLPKVTLAPARESGERLFRLKAARAMVAAGFLEAVNYSFVSPDHREKLGLEADDGLMVRLLNPLAEEQSVMRTSLLPGLLANLAHNLNRQSEGVRLFEVGKVFFSRGPDVQPDENTRMAAVMAGRRTDGAPVLHYGREQMDFFDASGAVEWFLDFMGYEADALEWDSSVSFGRGGAAAVRVNGVRVGSCGGFDPEVLRRFGIKQPAWFLDIDLDLLMGVKKKERSFRPLPKFPAVFRDIAVILPQETPAAALMDAVAKGGGGLLERAEIFDVFTGRNVEPGKKSVAVRLVFRSGNSTLKDKQVNRALDGILKVISAELGGKLRES